MDNIQHAGKIRGGGNWYARASVQFYAANIAADEGEALTGAFRASLEWTNQWIRSHSGEAVSSFEFALDTRREFSLLPLMIRRFAAFGYEVKLVNYDRGHGPTVSMTEDPATFWREVALAQMFFRED